MYDIQEKPNKNSNFILNIVILIIVIIVLYFLYQRFFKKENNKKNKNIREIQKNLVNSADYIDDPTWDFNLNCNLELDECESLSCPDGFIVLRKKNTCCAECVEITSEDVSNNISNLNTTRINNLKLFENKYISKRFNLNFNLIGYKTTDTLFNLIDRLLNFDYINFNFVKFLEIFNKEDEYIYIGIILIFFGLLFSFSKKKKKILIKENIINVNPKPVK